MKSSRPLLLLAAALLGGCAGAPPEADGLRLVQTVSEGQEVELSAHLEEGEWTVVQFTAPWCGACKQLEPQLLELVRKRGDVRLRRVDIKNWNSPVARQYRIQSIPQLWLHDGMERVSTDRGTVMTFLKGP